MSKLTERFSDYLLHASRGRLRVHGWVMLTLCMVAELGLCLLAGQFHQLPLEQKQAVMVPGAIGAVLVQMVLFTLEGVAAILLIQSGQAVETTARRK